MPDGGRRRRSPARLLAPLALVAFAVAVAAVVFSSPAVDGDEGGGDRASERTTTAPAGQAERRQRPRRRVYRVRAGDTLGAIAEQTGVPVERLLALNPELDPQALVAGQRIRLRE
jgi:Tfp pilus assembly protein FimV